MRRDSTVFIDEEAKVVVVSLLRRRRQGGPIPVITREVDISKDITLPSTTGNPINFKLVAGIQHIGKKKY